MKIISRGGRRFALGWVLAPSLFSLASCATADSGAKAACPESQAMQVENYPSWNPLPQDAVIEQQTAGHPPEYASDNYAIVAKTAGTIEAVSAFYRCMLPRQNLTIISEEQGNVLLIRFAGESVDDGSITLRGDGEGDETRIEIFVIEKERPDIPFR
ncbi:hypothetical protein [uncultured Parasphingorhabdus sp.]|uniref:hypothetical protein n=1 Tax=uncultured Parasphingorhabdus sp. TaxID=2709694 RepID=UPI0030D944AB